LYSTIKSEDTDSTLSVKQCYFSCAKLSFVAAVNHGLKSRIAVSVNKCGEHSYCVYLVLVHPGGVVVVQQCSCCHIA